MFTWLLILIFYIPFQIAFNISSTVDLASIRFFVVLFFINWFVLFIIRKSVALKKKRLINVQSVSLLLFLLFSSLSIIGAENINWSLRKIMYFLSIFPLYFLVANIIISWQQVKKVIKIIVGGGTLVVLLGLAQFLAQLFFGVEPVYSFWAVNIIPVFSGFNYGAMILTYSSWLVNVNGATIMRAFSLFSDPHVFSFYVGLLIPLVIILSLLDDKKHHQSNLSIKVTLLNCVLFFLALLLSFSRGAYVAAIVTFLTLAFLLWRYTKDKKISIIICSALLVFIIPGTPIADRFYSSFDASEGSNMGRLEMWQKAGNLGWQHPFLGVGLGNYALSLSGNYEYRNPATAHNFYLDLLSETGILTLFIWGCLILGTLGQLFKRLKNADQSSQYIIIGFIGFLVYFSVHSFFETVIYSPVILSLLMVILGLSTIVLYDTETKSL